MKRHLLAMLLCISPVFAEPPAQYPFEVTVGGHKAAVKADDDVFAVIAEPVQPDAMLVITEKSPMLIINAFPCKEDGTVPMDAPAAIIFAQDTNQVKLDATMDKKMLAPGTYLMNVVAHQKTSRVVFTVTDGKTPIKLPDISKIVGFFKGKR